ncbi:hypothetical protein [Roseomonas sp. CECT 9278]|uniref:hypothetical protein n=1 Tax=Roseomonas sp. CECT 9278 TaxID=2845823 RepID=UPI001E4DFD75|nr:hypothetical protein [Roseomonas sp. CECT 9278]
MSDKKKPYDVLIVEEYGEGKTKFYNVGVAFERDEGGMSVLIPPGISVSGRLTIMARKEKAEAP